MLARLTPLCLLAAVLVACGSSLPAAATTKPGSSPVASKAASAGVQLKLVGRFKQPLYVTAPPNDERRVMIVEQGGEIRVVRGGRTLAQPFLDVSDRIVSGGEQGLLGLAFAPDYRDSGLFYVYYTSRDGRENVVEYHRASADRADPGSARLVLRMNDPESNHNGGDLAFGPDDLLYIGTGDGGGAGDSHGAHGNAQNLGSPLGKLLRIDPRQGSGRAYRIPPSNPFVTRAGARQEIYAYGLRNPWRYSFDRSTGALVIGDVGQNTTEEVDFMARGSASGANFGWRALEGRRRFSASETAPRAVAPVITHSHASGWCSITGGYVVRDPRLPALRGRYVYGDYCQGRIRSARLSAGRSSGDHALALPVVHGLSSFGEDAAGRVYVVSLEGPVYRLARR